MQQIFVARVVLMEAVFSKINLRLDEGFLTHKMLEMFTTTGYGLTDILIKCTKKCVLLAKYNASRK